MLEKDRFLEIKNLAQEIRKENEELFESLKKVSLEEAIEEKEEFIENVINNMEIEFSEAEKGKAEMQIFRANILIPDDVEFFQEYSNDKNIRNLMNKYLVNVEDIMSKITELNIYGKYIDAFNEDKEEDFVEEMTKETENVSNDAMNLLEEVKSLTSDIDATLGEIEDSKEEFDLNAIDGYEEDSELDQEEEKINLLEPEEIPSIDIESRKDYIIDEPKTSKKNSYSKDNDLANLQDMSMAVSSFVDEYNALKEQNVKMKEELEKLQNKNSELSTSLNNQKSRANELEEENIGLKVQNQKLQSQVTESKAIISKIYSCITPKE